MIPPAQLGRRDAYALVALFALTAAVFWQYLFTTPTPLIFPESALGTDLPREIWPLARFVVNRLSETGELPLWRPYQTSGAPLLGHPVAPVFYPPNWLGLALPLALTLNLLAVGHLWWGGVGVYVYLRWQRGARWQAAFVGALVFALCPKWLAHLSGGHWPTLAAIVWWPWVWLAFTRYWTTRQIRWAALLGVALAAQALNHVTYCALSLVVLGVVTIGYLRRPLTAWLRPAVVGWGVALGLAVGLTAGQLWPLLALLPYANRGALTAAEASFGSVPPVLLLGTLFAPELKFPEVFIFAGAGAVALVLTGAAWGWSRREWGWAGAALGGLLLSLGSHTPLFALLNTLVPIFRLFRVPARWSLLTLFAVAVLAAWTVDRWLTPDGRPRRRAPLLVLGLGLVYVLAGAFKLARPSALPFEVLPSGLAVLVILALLSGPTAATWRWAAVVVVLFGELSWTAAGLIRPQAEAALAAPDALAAWLQPAAARGERSFAPYGGLEAPQVVVSDLRAADGYDSFLLLAYTELARQVGGCAYAGFVVAAPPTRASAEAVAHCPTFIPHAGLLRLLNIRYVILPAAAELPGATLALTDQGRWVYDYGPGLGRAFGVARAEVASVHGCAERLATIGVTQAALVEALLPFPVDAAAPVVLSAVAGVNTETFTVRATTAGLLVRSETWAPGWRATVDGAAAEVLRVDCALQGVWLMPGEHEVRFDYAPIEYAWGRWVSGVTALGLLAGGVGLAWQARRRLQRQRIS